MKTALQPITPASLKVTGATLLKGEATLIENIHLTLHAGEILAIIGPNGAGKSTLLNAIAGDLALNKGEILINGIDRKQWRNTELARCLAVLPQVSELHFPYLVEQVVALGRIPHSTGTTTDSHIIEEVMAMLDILSLRGRSYTALSGGEKQRTQIARVFTQIWQPNNVGTRVVLLDEPTAALDLGQQQQLMACIEMLAQKGVAIVMVVHDLNIALRYSTHIMALTCGQCKTYGKTSEVVTEQLLSDLFRAQLQLIPHPETARKVVIT